MVRFGPDTASCRVRTRRVGVLKSLGHDLELDVTDFTLSFSSEAGRVSGRFQADSLRVVGGLQPGGGPLMEVSAADKLTIERHIRDDVLRSGRFPEIGFLVEGLQFAEGTEALVGTLELCGVRREIAVRTRREAEHWTAQATVHQPDFGLAPFQTMLGGLRVHVDVEVEITVPSERLSGIGPPS